ncbi:hypothetical protein SEA_GUYFAGIERI_78 [Rhodococcus phage GuyFagieri]|nr:hypothetical protein SEA_GUYFAGIERI_78 [Rhodococcus phage GuyFagieri]
MADTKPQWAKLTDPWMSSIAFLDRLDRALFRQDQLSSLRRYQENLAIEESFD